MQILPAPTEGAIKNIGIGKIYITYFKNRCI